MVELEDHTRALRENAKKDKRELREEIKQSGIETRNAILEELRSMFGVGSSVKAKVLRRKVAKGSETLLYLWDFMQ